MNTVPSNPASNRVTTGIKETHYLYENLPVKIKTGISVKDIDTSGYIVVRAIYTSHTAQYMPKHAVFECSAVCLSVIIELLPGLIPFTSKWHAE